jgi:hypothetical protein
MDFNESDEYEVSERLRLLKIIHQTYIENDKLIQNVEHILDIMEEIARLEKILKEL